MAPQLVPHLPSLRLPEPISMPSRFQKLNHRLWIAAIWSLTLFSIMFGSRVDAMQSLDTTEFMDHKNSGNSDKAFGYFGTETQQQPKSTKDWIKFRKPADAQLLIGPNGSKLIPENPKIASRWTFSEGVLTASPKWDSVVTPDTYNDFVMHIEFNVNEAGNVEHERNGNSGLYLQLRYELQILNSSKVPFESYSKTDCGCIYGVKKPDQMACLPAGEWQSFDVALRAARFENGKKKENARITVYQNNKLIHDDFVLPRHTGAGKKEGPESMPIKLQGHHNQVQFRNFWIKDFL
jgi:hypothetical protein